MKLNRSQVRTMGFVGVLGGIVFFAADMHLYFSTTEELEIVMERIERG